MDRDARDRDREYKRIRKRLGTSVDQLSRFLRETYSIKILVKTFLLPNKKSKLHRAERGEVSSVGCTIWANSFDSSNTNIHVALHAR